MEIILAFLVLTILSLFWKVNRVGYRLDREIARSALEHDQLEFIVGNRVFLAGQIIHEDIVHDLIMRFSEEEDNFSFQIWNVTTDELIKEFPRFDSKVWEYWLYFTDKPRAAQFKFHQEMQRLEERVEKDKSSILDKIRKEYEL